MPLPPDIVDPADHAYNMKMTPLLQSKDDVAQTHQRLLQNVGSEDQTSLFRDRNLDTVVATLELLCSTKEQPSVLRKHNNPEKLVKVDLISEVILEMKRYNDIFHTNLKYFLSNSCFILI